MNMHVAHSAVEWIKLATFIGIRIKTLMFINFKVNVQVLTVHRHHDIVIIFHLFYTTYMTLRRALTRCYLF